MPSTLTILSSLPPEAFDALFPHGPRRARPGGGRLVLLDDLDLVALNPQPLPPRERFLVASAELAHALGRLVVEKDLMVGGGADTLRELVDDWCGTGWPRRWPFPWPGPGPGPRPDEADLAGGRLAGALVMASLAGRMPDSELGTAFGEAAARLEEVATQG